MNIDSVHIQTFTGSILAEKRGKLWEDAQIIVSTPQIIENDLLSARITLRDVALLIFDECHRAVGNYSYVYIAEKYTEQAKEPLVLGMTASPGSEKEKIREICTSLGVERVESRTEYDHDVAPFIFKKGFEWRGIEVPAEIKRQKRVLDEVLAERVEELRKLGFVRKKKGKEIYRVRAKTVERVFGHIKQNIGLLEFLTRGLSGVRAEFSLACIAHNLRRIWKIKSQSNGIEKRSTEDGGQFDQTFLKRLCGWVKGHGLISYVLYAKV